MIEVSILKCEVMLLLSNCMVKFKIVVVCHNKLLNYIIKITFNA